MKLNLLSFNIRINAPVDRKHAWDYRKEDVFHFINHKKFDIVGFQEPGPIMYQELKENLKNYDFFGAARSEGEEFTPIFIKKGLFEVIESDTLWLTDTPYTESKILGSHHNRIATYVVLKVNSNQYLTVINTHLDYANDFIIFNQIEYLYRMMRILEIKYNTEIILMGDFNTYPNSIGTLFLSTKYNQVYNDPKNIGLTYHAYTDKEEGLPIDYIFFSNSIKLESFQIIHHQEKGKYLSDHYPINALFNLNN
ncbi:MAG: endonuclease/exonuclease/phosphatase family protein [Acholeplasmataceae bacterium]|nr:endonuclease/exonuclease/phosphatase family protein [Acholeplasmataceae bacterium]